MGLRVCPDVDAVLYGLAGIFDYARGYGIRDDSFGFLERSVAAGCERWFEVGDRDLQTHLIRTSLLRQGLALSVVTARIADAFGLSSKVIPASDDYLRTRLVVDDRDLSFQDFFVRERGRSSPSAVRWIGLEYAAPAPGVIDAIEEADLVVLADSSPVASMLPTLSLAGVREALVRRGPQRVALSPMVMAAPPESPVDRHPWSAREMLMRAWGLEHNPLAVARLYGGLFDVFVMDRRDSGPGGGVAAVDTAVEYADLLGRSRKSREELVRYLFDLEMRKPFRAQGRQMPHTVGRTKRSLTTRTDRACGR